MKKNSLIISLSLAIIPLNTHSYTVNVSNFTKPRPKTLRRIAKNLSLALAIDTIHTNPIFTPEQQVLLKSIPLFISGKFTSKSIVQLKDGSRFTLEHTIPELKKLEITLLALTQDQALAEKSSYEKVLKSVTQLIEHLGKIV